MAGNALPAAAVASMMPSKEPEEVKALYDGVTAALDTDYGDGRKVGNCQYGVYLFYDYDGEPIYVGRTRESLRTRIRRHLTNQRTDAVAMSVLDPFEVAEIEMWPFLGLEDGASYRNAESRRVHSLSESPKGLDILSYLE